MKNIKQLGKLIRQNREFRLPTSDFWYRTGL